MKQEQEFDCSADREVYDIAAAYVQKCVDAWEKSKLDPEPLFRGMALHAIMSLAVRLGAGPIAADLRALADQLPGIEAHRRPVN